MRVELVGAGRVGSAYARLWAQAGHEVSIRARDQARVQALVDQLGGACVASPQTAAAADALVLFVPADAVPDALENLGSLDGRVLIDATNGTPAWRGEHASNAEAIAARVPGARVVKALNAVFAPVVAAGPGRFDGRPALMPLCGDDGDANAQTSKLIDDAGFQAADVGPLSQAGPIEKFAEVVITLAYGRGFGEFGLQMLPLHPAAAPAAG